MKGSYEDEVIQDRNAKLMTLLPLLQERNGGVLECRDRIVSTRPMLRNESSTLEDSQVLLKLPRTITRCALSCSDAMKLVKSVSNCCQGSGFTISSILIMVHCWL